MNNPPALKSKKPDPDTDSWYQYVWKIEQDTPNRLEDAAKFLASMISVSLTIFLSIGGKDVFAQFKSVWLLKPAVGLWILSLYYDKNYCYYFCRAFMHKF